MNQTFDVFFYLNKHAKGCDAFNFTGYSDSQRIPLINGKPWIGIHLLHTQRYSPLFLVGREHNSLYGISNLYKLFGMLDLLCPAHFRNMDQTFYPGFQLNKSAIIGDVYHFTRDVCAFGIFRFDVFPWVRNQLFETQRYFLVLFIKVQYLYPHFIADVQHVGGVFYMTPGHICDVQQSIDTTKINKGTVIGDVAHFAIQLSTFHQESFQLFQARFLSFYQHFFARNDEISTVFVYF